MKKQITQSKKEPQGISRASLNIKASQEYYKRIREEQKANGEYVDRDAERLKDEKEIMKMESEIGFDRGNGRTYDPHAAPEHPDAHIFVNTQNGSKIDITDPEEAEVLMNAGVIRPL